ncbi:MAG: TPM domain-containing protein [Tabrizicola sp.]|nr:TPM domain-containing protein [Tabrizicola sp.]
MLRLMAVLLLLPFGALAEDLPKPLSDTVSDFGDVLSGPQEAELQALITETRDATGVHLVVVTMGSIAEHGGQGQRMDAYAKALLNAWGIGDAQRNDGILILVSSKDRETRIALGSGYDVVYDGRAQRVIDTAMLPRFREGRMADGIIDGVKSARDRLVAPFIAGQPVTVDEGFPGPDRSILIGLGVFAGAAGLILAVRARKGASARCPQCGQRTLTRRNDSAGPATDQGPASGTARFQCSACGFSEDRDFAIAQRRDSDRNRRLGRRSGSSGRGGGFGGGGSSGGGASGKW